jgi:hypothetical protein
MTEAVDRGPLDVDRRPGVVTFVGILLLIQAAMAAIGGIFA